MREPLRESTQRTPPAEDAERATRIEELLVSGLDQYFAAEYEQAINIWTRVVFLERDHDRARAYIDRARTAIAERQRESEELLHHGVDAYESGDTSRARDLLTRAVDQGAPSDEALVLLQRLDRLEGAGFGAHPYPGAASPRASTAAVGVDSRRWPQRWVVAGIVVILAVGVIALGGNRLLSWLTDVPEAGLVPVQTRLEPLPIVRTPDVLLERARSLFAGGHLYDALRVLDGIAMGDPARAAADQLRGDIQRVLLAVASPPGTGRGRSR